MEKDVGDYDHTARTVLGPVFIIVGTVSLAGSLTVAAGTLGLVIAVAALLVGVVLATMTVTRRYSLSDLLGVDTYKGATAIETKSAGKPHTQ